MASLTATPLDPRERFKTALVGRVFLARALNAINEQALSDILAEVRAARERVGRELLYWPIFCSPVAMPDATGRAAMQRATPSLFEHCESMTPVILGSGIGTTLLCTALRGMITIGGDSSRIRIATSLAEAVAAADDADISLPSIEAAVVRAGLLV